MCKNSIFSRSWIFWWGYSAAESAYDSLVERYILKFNDIDLIVIQELAVQKLKSYSVSKDNASMFQIAFNMEKECGDLIEKLCASPLKSRS